MRRLLITVIGCIVTCAAAAQEGPVVRVAVTPDRVTVGEPVQLRVTVLVPTWFPRPPTFPSFELANTITRLPPNSSRPTSERIGRDTWSGIVRNYEVYPLLGATYRVTGLVLGVTYANPDTPGPITVDVPVPEIEFRAQVPAGAETMDPYVAGRRLTLTGEIASKTSGLTVGDALVMRYVAELDGMPAIFLPPLVRTRDLEIPGVSVYAAEPVLEDDGVGRRSEKVTYVFGSGGVFTVPEVTISWWNTETGAIETASTPARNVSVAGPPLSSTAEEASGARPWGTIAAWIAGALLLGWLLSRALPLLGKRWRTHLDTWRQSERCAFRRLKGALRSGDRGSSYRALLQWLHCLQPGTVGRQFALRYGDEALQTQLELLNRAVFSAAQARVDLKALERALTRARRVWLKSAQRPNRIALPVMNPHY